MHLSHDCDNQSRFLGVRRVCVRMDTAGSNAPAFVSNGLLQKALSTFEAADERFKKIQMRVSTTQQRVRQDLGQALASRLTLARQRSLRLGPSFASLHAPGGAMNSPDGTSREDQSHLSASRVASRPSGKVSGSLWGPRGVRAKGDDQPAKENAPYASCCCHGRELRGLVHPFCTCD